MAKQAGGRSGNPVSLKPLSFERALSGLLAVDPAAVRKPEKKKVVPKKRPAAKATKKKRRK